MISLCWFLNKYYEQQISGKLPFSLFCPISASALSDNLYSIRIGANTSALPQQQDFPNVKIRFNNTSERSKSQVQWLPCLALFRTRNGSTWGNMNVQSYEGGIPSQVKKIT